MPTTRKRTARNSAGGMITAEAVRLYREGLAAKGQARYALSRQLRDALNLDVLSPCLLRSYPEFLLSVPDERSYRAQWAELKGELEEATNG